MGTRLSRFDQRTRAFFGGPGAGLFAVVLAFFFVVPGVGKMVGLDSYGIAIVFAVLALCIIGIGRVARRLQ